LFLLFESQQGLCRRVVEENYFFLFVSCGQVVAIGNARIALIAGSIAVDAGPAGGAYYAVLLADLLAPAIVCVVFAHLRPVFHAAPSKYGLLRCFSDAAAIALWRAHATILFARTMIDAAIFGL
jgi:hypothetical protein